MQARYYDPVIGRFYSNDPIGFKGVHSFNRYN
jgi:RHS repeat-associated protein